MKIVFLLKFLNFSVDSKTFVLPDLGELQKVRVLHDNSGAAPSWFLKKVSLLALAVGYAINNCR